VRVTSHLHGHSCSTYSRDVRAMMSLGIVPTMLLLSTKSPSLPRATHTHARRIVVLSRRFPSHSMTHAAQRQNTEPCIAMQCRQPVKRESQGGAITCQSQALCSSLHQPAAALAAAAPSPRPSLSPSLLSPLALLRLGHSQHLTHHISATTSQQPQQQQHLRWRHRDPTHARTHKRVNVEKYGASVPVRGLLLKKAHLLAHKRRHVSIATAVHCNLKRWARQPRRHRVTY
jgi:hypothetical protein